MKHTLFSLGRAGARCARDMIHLRGSLGGLSGAVYARAVLGALRPHFFALPAGAAFAGASAPERVESGARVALAAAAAALGWGVGQLLNDLFDVGADAIDAPQRPAVRGLLPEGPTVLVALGLGLLVTAATIAVHPRAFLLALGATVLLLSYDALKPYPLLGNLAHGALIALASLIGAAAATPDRTLPSVVAGAWSAAALSGAWAAVYLEANYEKDRLGDARAGKLTLPRLIGLRASAALRALVALGLSLAAWHTGLCREPTGAVFLGIALLLLLISVTSVFLRPTEGAALKSYRFAVHAAAIGMLALGSRALGPSLTVLAVAASIALSERAFARAPNP